MICSALLQREKRGLTAMASARHFASLDFPNTPLRLTGCNTVRLPPDDPDYNVIVELPTTNALGLAAQSLASSRQHATSASFLTTGRATVSSAQKHPEHGSKAGGEMRRCCCVYDDGTKAIVPINTLTVPDAEIGNLDISLDPGDVRTLGGRYPLEIVDDPQNYFSLPLTGQWMPVAMQADYDDVNKVLTAEHRRRAAMPMLATERY